MIAETPLDSIYNYDADRQRNYIAALQKNPALAATLQLKLTDYIPHEPTPKQRLFLLLPHREVFYGGAAGGGKSDALLMGALQHVDVPGYSAIIFRKNLTDANLPGAILDRSHEWLDGTDCEFKNNTWYFPSGAKLSFGFLADELKKYRYQGAEFQYIAFDELTQFWEDDYLYLRSRLRRTKCPYHGGHVTEGKSDPLPPDPKCRTCANTAQLGEVPLRMRAAANPGGVGHLWVKKRFNIGPWITGYTPNGKPQHKLGPNGKTLYIGRNKKRPFIPALLPDNPHLDAEEYAESLRELDPVTREQLLNGDWSVSADGRIRKAWQRFYSINPAGYLILGQNRRGPTYLLSECTTFTICDPAASTREGPGDEQVYRGAPSWTVFGTFLLTYDNHLIVWDWRRFRGELDEIYRAAKTAWKLHRPEFIGMEHTSMSTHLFQAFIRAGLPMKALRPGSRDKLQRATDVINRMEQGRVWFPQDYRPWMEDLESELFTWTAHPHEPDDQIDVMAYAGLYVSARAAYQRGEDTIRQSNTDLMPEVV